MKNSTPFLVMAFSLMVGMLFSSPVFGQTCANSDPTLPVGITPIYVSGNTPAETPTNVKIEPVVSGTYTLGAGSVTISVTNEPGSCGEVLTWSVSPGIVIDFVYAKATAAYNSYDYTGENPRPDTDGNLHAPLASSGKYAAFSHLNFVFHYELDVAKTASTSFTRTYSWTVEKSVTPDTWNLFAGDRGVSQYTVILTKDFVDSDWKVEGTITIANNTPLDAVITSVTDVVSPAFSVVPDCGVTFPYTLVAGASLTCTYDQMLPDASFRTNDVTVQTSTPMVEGGTASADVDFAHATITEVLPEVNLTDVLTDPSGVPESPRTWGPFTGNATIIYAAEFECGSDVGVWTNRVTIDETGDYDEEDVTVNCYEPVVTKTAETELDRTWTWTIDKSCSDPLVLALGQTYTLTYDVLLDASAVDSDWKVTGDISVYNPAPMAATINSLSDVVSPAIAATVDCGLSFPITLAAGATLHCTYSADLPDAATRTNTATATLQNYSYDYQLNATVNGTTDFSGVATVDFSTAIVNNIDGCVDVTDTYAGTLGTVCFANAPYTFTYSRNIVYQVCGNYTVDNTASFVTNVTQTTGSDYCSIPVTVPCTGGCTLTPGYWKTHSEYGPAPYDDTWALLPDGADTDFFLSGQSYYEVLWTPPSGGNAYYILAHAYIAANLNFLNDADPSAVTSTFNAATALFTAYTPAQVAAAKGKNGRELRQQFIDLATTLDNYNNGLIGPGHCSVEPGTPVREAVDYTIDVQEVGRLQLYPNPASREVQINLTDFLGQSGKLEIFDATGAMVWSEEFAMVNNKVYSLYLDPARFATGVYYVSMQSRNLRISNVLLVNTVK